MTLALSHPFLCYAFIPSINRRKEKNEKIKTEVAICLSSS